MNKIKGLGACNTVTAPYTFIYYFSLFSRERNKTYLVLKKSVTCYKMMEVIEPIEKTPVTLPVLQPFLGVTQNATH